MKIDTLCVQGGWTPKKGEPRQLPIYSSTTFKYETTQQMGDLFDLKASGYFYTRLANPTNDQVAKKIAALEGGVAAILTSSGQAASTFAILNLCNAGDHVVSSAQIYGGTFNLFAVSLKKLGIEFTFVDPDASPEELGYAGAIFIEFDEIDRAIDSLERLREFLPFDKDMLHQLGYCYLKKGRREQAEQTYRMLLESDESDTVAAYYENAIRTTEPDDFLRSWSLHYDVPMYEFLKRQRRLQQVAEGGIEAVKELWQNDPSFHDLLRWALFSQLVTFRKAVVRMLAIVGDEEAQKLLRRFLISYDQSDEEKQFVFGTLLSLEAKPPFALYMGGQWQYGAVQPLSVPEKLPRSYAFVLWNIQQVKHKAEAFDQKHGALVTDRVIEVAIRIFLYFTASLDHRYPRLTPAQENAMSAAFVLLALSSLDLSNIPPDMLCDWYGISRRRLENALQKIFRQLQKEKES